MFFLSMPEVGEETENGNKRHTPLMKVFESPWENKTSQITAKSKGNISEQRHAGFSFTLGWQHLGLTFRFRVNGIKVQSLASKTFSREVGEIFLPCKP